MPTPEPVKADENTDASADRNGTPGPTEPEGHAIPEHGVDAPDTAPDSTTTKGGTVTTGIGAAAPPDTPSSRAAAVLPSPLIVLVFGVTGLAGWFSWTRAELDWGNDGGTVYLPFVFVLGGWIVSVALHEFAHTVLAYRFGDRTLRGSGYLRLNPFAYRDLFANLLLPVAFPILGAIGLTGPTGYLDYATVRGRGRRTLVALAGPATSLLIAVALAVAIATLVEPDARTNNWALAGLMYLCYLNLAAALVSLLPIPGLDGFDAVASFLPERVVRRGRALGLFGVIAVFGVLWFPPVRSAFLVLMLHVFTLVGVPQIDINLGLVVFQFWGL